MKRQMLIVLLIISFVFSLFACETRDDNDQSETDQKDSIIEQKQEELPEEILTWLENMRQYFAAGVVDLQDDRYIIVNWGEKRTAGYEVTITDILKTNERLNVQVLFNEPEEKTAQIISYPFTVKKTKADERTVFFEAEGVEEFIPVVVGQQPVKPFIVESENIKIMDKDISEERILIKGLARVFEANINYTVKDVEENLLIESFTTAASGGPYWGSFTIEEKELPRTASLINIFSISAKDGSRENEVQLDIN